MSENKRGSCQKCEKRRLKKSKFCYGHSPKCTVTKCNNLVKRRGYRCKEHLNISFTEKHSGDGPCTKKEKTVCKIHGDIIFSL